MSSFDSTTKSDGMQEKLVAVRRTAKVVKGGRIFSFTAIVVVGDGIRITIIFLQGSHQLISAGPGLREIQYPSQQFIRNITVIIVAVKVNFQGFF